MVPKLSELGAGAPPKEDSGKSDPLPARRPLRPPIRLPDTDQATKGSMTAAMRTARTKRARPAWTKALERAVQEFAACLKADYASQINQDAEARAFKKLCVRMLKQSLPPGPGRPSEDSITQATTLHAKGTAWKEIYPQCIPRYASLTPAERYQAEARLRSARRSRENAQAKGKRRRQFVAGNITAPHFFA